MTPKLKRVIRLDSLPLGQTMFTHEGYLMDRPILTSVGIFEYHNPDGSVRRELRLPDEVFAKESLESYKGKPIIVTHEAGLIDKNNVHDESIGTILSDGYQDGDDVRAEIVIHDTDEMRECRLKELSLGYNLDLDEINVLDFESKQHKHAFCKIYKKPYLNLENNLHNVHILIFFFRLIPRMFH